MNLTFSGDFQKTIQITETFRAPRKQIYSVWTEPKHLKNWFMADQGFSVVNVSSDLRVAGEYRLDLTYHGDPSWVTGTFKEITELSHLKYTWLVPLLKDRWTEVEVSFYDEEQGSSLKLEHAFFEDKTELELHAQGWTGCLGRLQEYLTELS